MELYGDPQSKAIFREFMAAYPDVRFFHPSFEKAPWHVIAEVPGADGVTRRAHFWPHKMKACPEDGDGRPEGPAQVGIDAMHDVIALSRIAPSPADLLDESDNFDSDASMPF